MGVRDRDYMKRPSDDDEDSSPESKAEEFAQRVLARTRKPLLIGGIALVILIIVAFIMSKTSGGSQ